MELSGRFKAPQLLVAGACCGICGFVFAFVIGTMKFYLPRYKVNHYGKPYASGNGYWPSTVSEMISEWDSNDGRIFFAFSLIASLCIFMSYYPYNLRNAYTGPAVFGWPLSASGEVYWATLRQFLPPLGLLLLICVPTVPEAIARDVDYFSIVIHLMGAQMMFIGYLVCELKVMQIWPFKDEIGERYLAIEGRERSVRMFLCVVIMIGFVGFVTVYGLLIVNRFLEEPLFCCTDKWAEAGEEAPEKYTGHPVGRWPQTVADHRRMDTASGTVLKLKMTSFMLEVTAGLAIIFSHLAVACYAEEAEVPFAHAQLQEVHSQKDE